MRLARTVALTMLLVVVRVAGSTPDAQSPPATPAVKTLMQMPLADAFTPGREVLVDLVQIPADTALERHWHPGEEFHYYLEGQVEIRIEGEPTIVGTPGTAGHVPFKKRHVAVAGKQGAKVVVFRVHTTGEPWRYVDKGDAPAR